MFILSCKYFQSNVILEKTFSCHELNSFMLKGGGNKILCYASHCKIRQVVIATRTEIIITCDSKDSCRIKLHKTCKHAATINLHLHYDWIWSQLGDTALGV